MILELWLPLKKWSIHFSPPDKPSYAYQMVRTDSREQKLEAFVVPRSLQISAPKSSAELSGRPSQREGGREIEVSIGGGSDIYSGFMLCFVWRLKKRWG